MLRNGKKQCVFRLLQLRLRPTDVAAGREWIEGVCDGDKPGENVVQIDVQVVSGRISDGFNLLERRAVSVEHLSICPIERLQKTGLRQASRRDDEPMGRNAEVSERELWSVVKSEGN